MKKKIGYRQGYRITIRDCFYEVTEGKRVLYFGECRKNSTIQEIANQTILLNQIQEGNAIDYRRKSIEAVIGKRIS